MFSLLVHCSQTAGWITRTACFPLEALALPLAVSPCFSVGEGDW